jgi:tetratricopeptide (TPR) repeat protein
VIASADVVQGDKITFVGVIPTASALHQLPTPPSDFTGRQEDLDFLRSRLAQGGTGAIFGLRGMGGVGKTTLALKLADELKPRFPDAQIYLDLKGVDPRPLTSAQAMAHVIRSFHPEAPLTESEAELAGLYRSVLDGKRVLLLMDNAARKEQVEPLVPPSTCLLLVTSRSHFVLPGLLARDLDEMPETDARTFLLTIAPRIGDAADEIARLCGRLPLALRLAGSALAERLNLSPSEYIRRFQEGKERFSEVDVSLNLSYELLDEERRRLWRMLAVFPGTFDGPAAAAVWDLPPDSAQDALGELVRRSLVEWEEKEQRYGLHDLSRAFATGRLEPGEREAGQRRLAEHFLAVLRAADDLFLQGGTSIQAALRLFDAEWGNIQAGHAWAATHPPGDDTAARICDEYPDAGTYVLSLRQPAREQIRWRELGLAAARQGEDRVSEGSHLCNLGLAYADLGETRRAIELYEQALIIDREIGDRRGEGADLGNMGNTYVILGETRRAIELHEQQLAIAREIGDRHGEGNAIGSLGIAYAALGEARRAIELHEQYLAIAREIGDRRGEGGALGSLGLAYANLGETRRAIELYERRLAIAREIGDRRGEGNALGNLGIAYKSLGEPRRAIELYEQQLAIVREIGDRRREGNACWNLGLAYEAEGDLARAAKLMQVMVDFEREIGHSDAEKHAARVEALRARIADQASGSDSAP